MPKSPDVGKTGKLPLVVDRDSPEQLQLQIFYGIQRLIIDGLLSPGAALPSFRDIAAQLQVSKNTVILAFQRLTCEGYLSTKPGVGTFVSTDLPDHALLVSQHQPTSHEKAELLNRRHPLLFHGRLHVVAAHNRNKPRIDFAIGEPAPETFPARDWKTILARKLDHRHGAMSQYRDPAGLPELREAIAERLGPTRGMRVDPEQVIIVGGAQEALNLISRLLVASETRVIVESPCYQGAAYVFQAARAKIVPVEVDANGLNVAQLPDDPASLIYVTPSHQYPLGATMTLKRRFELLEWAWDTGAYIVEDDYDSDFRYTGSPLFALAGLDRHESVIYLGTFSKSIGPGIRVGYIVAPPALVKPLTVLKGLLNNGNPWLEQAVLAEFISDGGFDRHLRQVRRLYQIRQSVLIEAIREHFGEADISGADNGMHLVWTLPSGHMTANRLSELALEKGIGIYPLEKGASSFATSGNRYENMLMMGFPAVPENDIRKAIKTLAPLFFSGRG